VTAVVYRLVRWLRLRVRETVLLTALVAIIAGSVFSFAAGAHRTSTAPDRFSARYDQGFDLQLMQQHGPPLTADIAGLPAVRRVNAATFVFGGLVDPRTEKSIDGIVFAGDPGAIGRITIGRAPDPSNPHEFVASRNLLSATGLRLGDSVRLLTLTQSQADAEGFAVAPEGPTVEATVVGVIESPSELDDPSPVAVFPAALLGEGDIGVAATPMVVDLNIDSATTDFRSQLDALPDGAQISVAPLELVSSDTRKAVDAQSVGLWILAGVIAVASIAVLGQLVGRQVRMAPAERLRLAALGATEREVRIETIARSSVVVVVGTMVGAVVAVVASPLFPLGFARRVEPSPGLRVDLLMLIPGALVLVLSVLVWITFSVTMRDAERAAGRTRAQSSWSGWRSARATTGARFALTEQPGDTASPRTTIIGVSLIVAAMVGAAMFGVSLNRLVTEPHRFGSNFDLTYDVGAVSIPETVRSDLESSADISALTYYGFVHSRHDGVDVPVEGMELSRGSLTPVLIRGHLPVAPTDIALGRVTARDIGASIGDTISLSDGDNEAEFRVTGYVVMTQIGGLDQVGVGALTTMAGLRSLDPSAVPLAATFDLVPGVQPITFVQQHRDVLPFDLSSDQVSLPASIRNVARVRSIPVALTATLGGLALVTVVNVMFTSIHRRRRQLAILRAVGADNGWIAGMSRWQAVVFTLLPALAGTVVGTVAAQLVFSRFADSIGALSDASIPVVLVLFLIGGLVTAGLITATFSARRELHRNTAVILRSE
jgi:putative ABC transport system permease protein